MPRYHVTVGENEYDIHLERRGTEFALTINGRSVEVRNQSLGQTRSLLFVDNQSYEVDIQVNGNNGEKLVFMTGLEIPVEVEDYHLAQIRKAAGISTKPAVERVLRAPMPGLVMKIRVSEGETVKKGTPLVVIEAMKMENIIKAMGDAKVKAIHVQAGQSVEKNDKLLEFE
jgi:biotin carboxyl carrier protein